MRLSSQRGLLVLFLGLYALICLAPVASLLSTILGHTAEASLWSRLWQSGALGLTLKSSGMAGLAVGVAALVGIPLGLSLGAAGRRIRLPDLVFFLPLAIPPYLTASCWQSILGRNGLLPNAVAMLTGWDLGTAWLAEAWGSGMVLGFTYFPILVYLVITGLHSTGSSLEDAARLHLPEKRIMLSITLPLLLPHILTGALLVFLLALTNYAVPALLGFKTITIKIYAHFSIFQNTSGAVLQSLPLVLVGIITVAGVHHLTRKKGFFSHHLEQYGIGKLSFLQSPIFTTTARGLALGVIATPLAFLLIKTENIQNMMESLQGSMSFICNSFLLAFFGSLLLSILAFFIGYAAERIRLINNWVGRALLFLPFALPAVLVAIGLILVWNRPGLDTIYRSLFILILLWGGKYLPLAQRIIADQLRYFPDSWEEAAQTGGLPWLKTMLFIVWPLSRPGFLLTWCVLYIFCLSELGGMLLIIPPGADMLPVRLYNIMHYGSTGLMAAQGLVLVIIALGPPFCLALAGHFLNRWCASRS